MNMNGTAVSREDGKEGGESTAILYRTKRFLPEQKQTLWFLKPLDLFQKDGMQCLKGQLQLLN